jgi:Putative beta-barrel porin-2, OmpL-like. bbp2
MRTVGSKWVGLVAASVLVAGPAFAGSEVDKELAEMRELVKGLEQRVEAQEEQIEHQGGLLQDAQKVVRETQEEETLSGIGEFWQAIDVNMSVAGSYAWNFHDPSRSGTPFPSSGTNTGNSGLFYPFHPDHNSFQVDQVWFDIGKAGTEESRAGFHTTILFGTTASFLGQAGNLNFSTVTIPDGTDFDGDGTPDVVGDVVLAAPQSRRAFSDSTSDYYVHQAYVSYLAPLGEGVNMQFGKFATLVGAEVADATKNWQVTRGNLYNLLQPIDHLGLLTSTTIGPISLAAGVVNESNLTVSSPDINDEKTYLAKVGFATDMFGLATNVVYGAEGIGAFVTGGDLNSQRQGLVDVLATLNTDAFSMWANADYAWVEGSRASAWGFAVAGMVPLTEVFSAAVRLEYLRDKEDDSVTGISGDPFALGNPFRHSEVYGATGTLAYEFAENLTVKTEVRWDRVVEDTVSGLFPKEFLTNTAGGSKDQVVGLAQVIYAF